MTALKKLHLLLMLTLLIPVSTIAGKYDSFIEAFEDNSDYIRPLSTILGTGSNCGWYRTANVDREFAFQIGFPMSISIINDDDRSYTGVYRDPAVAQVVAMGGELYGAPVEQKYTAPTLFGEGAAPEYVKRYYVDMFGNILMDGDQPYVTTVLMSSGMGTFSDLKVIPFGTLQASFSLFYTSIHLRMIGAKVPKKFNDLGSMAFPGFGIQHDFHSIFPNLPVDLALAANITFQNMTFRPGKNIAGELELNGVANGISLLVGKSFRLVDLTASFGWENQVLKSGGELYITDSKGNVDLISPNVTLKGNNTIRAGVTVSLKAGGFTPTVTHSFGKQMNTAVDLFSFKVGGKKGAPRKRKRDTKEDTATEATNKETAVDTTASDSVTDTEELDTTAVETVPADATTEQVSDTAEVETVEATTDSSNVEATTPTDSAVTVEATDTTIVEPNVSDSATVVPADSTEADTSVVVPVDTTEADTTMSTSEETKTTEEAEKVTDTTAAVEETETDTVVEELDTTSEKTENATEKSETDVKETPSEEGTQKTEDKASTEESQEATKEKTAPKSEKKATEKPEKKESEKPVEKKAETDGDNDDGWLK